MSLLKALAYKKVFIYLSLLCLFLCGMQSYAQELSGPELLKKAIAYHDPSDRWSQLKGQLTIEMASPDGSQRLSEVTINLPDQYFKLTSVRNNTAVTHIVSKDSASFGLNDKTTFTAEEIKKYSLTETRAKFMKNYYTYLYGLPMKLSDAGTIINPTVTRKEFMGKEYLVLQVKYEEGIGKDVWYFYFDPKTYAMEIYQFYHDEAKNDGEYILLTEEETFSGIKFPKNRAWYQNTDKKFLATDKLTKVSELK
ncbi:DUF6503 family protein [Flavobacterium sp.]|uniref:DUF6503 family protein n=1 Tax=Flavobacterium sp. TaxID=239 RepID=UPI0026311ACC|nr:DUF6503 family protein [Flavobacterium sp.]MDG2431191.1 DUF6503 family protein [Flavobacterium sp.]